MDKEDEEGIINHARVAFSPPVGGPWYEGGLLRLPSLESEYT